eukprot:EG_transcript_30278
MCCIPGACHTTFSRVCEKSTTVPKGGLGWYFFPPECKRPFALRSGCAFIWQIYSPALMATHVVGPETTGSIHRMDECRPGMPHFWLPVSGWVGRRARHWTVQKGAACYYEYLLKQWLITDRVEDRYREMFE